MSAIATRSLSRMLAAVLLARVCGLELYGVFVICVAIESIATALLNACNLAPMLSIGPGLPDSHRDAFLRHAAARHIRWSIWVAITCGLFATMISDADLGWLCWGAFALAVFSSSALNAVRAIQQARFQLRRGFAAEVTGFLVPVAAVWLTASCEPSDVLTVYFITWALAAGSAAASCLPLWSRRDTGAALVPRDVMRRFDRMGLPMAVGSAANTACSRVQPFVLQAAAGAATVSAFGVAATTIGPIRMLSMALSSVVRPRLALLQERATEAWSLATKVCLLIAAAGACGILLALMVGASVIAWAFGAEYAHVGQLLPLACIFATLEATAAILVVAIQVMHADGAAIATRMRVGVSGLSILLVWPACSYGAASGAFTTLCLTELLFLLLAATAMQRLRRATDEVAVASAA